MRSVKDGDLAALGELYRRYQAKVYDYFLRMTRDESLSCDLLQNTFERVMKGRKTYSGNQPFVGWLFRIAKNVRMDHYRRQKVKVVDEASNHDRGEWMDNSHLDKSDLERALDQMDPDFREVLLLTRFEELKYKEVAMIVGISETGVKSRVHRAVTHLRSIYLTITKTT